MLLLADTFESAETLWGRDWRRRARFTPAPEDGAAPKVSVHLPVCNEPPAMVRETLRALAGTAPNVNIRTSSGEPGSSAFVLIRGADTCRRTLRGAAR